MSIEARICPSCHATNVGPQDTCLICHEPLTQTRLIPPGGLSVWNEPQSARLPVSQAAEGLEVTLIERRGDWARVRFSNGWEAWLDGRRLVTPG